MSSLLVLSFPLRRVSSCTKAAVPEAPSLSTLAAPQVLDTSHPAPHFPHQLLLSPCGCFRTQRSATMRPTTSPRSASSSTTCHARCCSSSRPTTCCVASRPPWAPVPAPAPSSTCHVAASERWPRECGLQFLFPPQLFGLPQESRSLPLSPSGPQGPAPVSQTPDLPAGI